MIGFIWMQFWYTIFGTFTTPEGEKVRSNDTLWVRVKVFTLLFWSKGAFQGFIQGTAKILAQKALEEHAKAQKAADLAKKEQRARSTQRRPK